MNLIGKWKHSGLLDCIPQEEKEIASNVLEDAFQYISHISRYRFIPGEIETSLFPILVRIMRDKKIFEFDMKKFVDELITAWIESEQKIDYKQLAIINVDYEAEFCALFADNYKI